MNSYHYIVYMLLKTVKFVRCRAFAKSILFAPQPRPLNPIAGEREKNASQVPSPLVEKGTWG